MGNNAASQRSLHTNSIKSEILSYLDPSGTESLGYKIAFNLQKADRGLNSHATARFLIPRQHLQAFETDPDRYTGSHQPLLQTHSPPHSVISRFCDDEDDDHRLIAEEWPTFLYDEYSGWNEKDRKRGLFRGHVLARVSQAFCNHPPTLQCKQLDSPSGCPANLPK